MCLQVNTCDIFLDHTHVNGESAKKSHKNDSGLEVFKLRGKVDKVWANNTGEKEEQRRLNRSLGL